MPMMPGAGSGTQNFTLVLLWVMNSALKMFGGISLCVMQISLFFAALVCKRELIIELHKRALSSQYAEDFFDFLVDQIHEPHREF